MGHETDWTAVVTLIAGVASIGAAIICLRIWRAAKKAIVDGDIAVKDHSDRSIAQLRQTVSGMHRTLGDVSAGVKRIESVQSERQGQVESIREDIARLESHQENEEKHVLRPRDLGALHTRINTVAEELAAARAQSTAENRGLGEQLKVLQRLVQDNLALRRSERP
jgi:phage host-nuclease inhibitor protein Gam